MQIILINGAPRVGKDTAGEILQRIINGRPGDRMTFKDARVMKFAQVLKEKTHAVYGMPNMHHSAYEANKDVKLDAFMGVTPRQAYIAMSEGYLKPLHGDAVLGHILADRIERYLFGVNPVDCVIVTDSGFRGEAEVLVRKFGPSNTTLIRMSRPGHTFEGDSRGPIDLSDLGVRCVDVTNDGTLNSLERKLREVMS